MEVWATSGAPLSFFFFFSHLAEFSSATGKVERTTEVCRVHPLGTVNVWTETVEPSDTERRRSLEPGANKHQASEE